MKLRNIVFVENMTNSVKVYTISANIIKQEELLSNYTAVIATIKKQLII